VTPPEQPERPRRPRTEGNVHYLETQFRARVQMMVMWEARLNAREIVKARIKRKGKMKVPLMSATPWSSSSTTSTSASSATRAG
jgi:hypothetical protein